MMTTDYSREHAYLQSHYGDLYKGDTMIPHTYTHAQKALLHVVATAQPTNIAALSQLMHRSALKHGVTINELFEELISNSLFSAWLKDLHKKVVHPH
jgi:hypothetical protein